MLKALPKPRIVFNACKFWVTRPVMNRRVRWIQYEWTTSHDLYDRRGPLDAMPWYWQLVAFCAIPGEYSNIPPTYSFNVVFTICRVTFLWKQRSSSNVLRQPATSWSIHPHPSQSKHLIFSVVICPDNLCVILSSVSTAIRSSDVLLWIGCWYWETAFVRVLGRIWL